MKNRTLLGVLCLVCALLLVFVAAPLLTRLQDGRTTILRLVRNVEKGHRITETDLETAEVGAFNLPAQVMTDPQTAVGKYASVDLRPGDWLLTSKLTDRPDSASDVFRLLNGEEKALSVTLPDYAAGLSGKLENGDVVSVCVTANGETVLPPELTYIRVITATTGKGVDKDTLEQKDDGSTDAPATVTLLVNDEQQRLLVHYEHTAKIHFSLVYRGDDSAAQAFLDAQKAYFASREAGDGLTDGSGDRTGGTSEREERS